GLRRLKLADRPLRIASAHSGILPGAKRQCAAALLFRSLLGGDKSPRDGLVYGGMQGIDGAGEQAVVRVGRDVLYEIAQIPAAAGAMGFGGAAERLVLDRRAFLGERHGEPAADMLSQAFI